MVPEKANACMLEKTLTPRAQLLIEHLVHLGELRERDSLLQGLTQALAKTLLAQSVTLTSLVQDKGRQYWLPLTSSNADAQVQIVIDPLRADIRSLVPMQADEIRWRSVQDVQSAAVQSGAGAKHWRTVFPIVLAGEDTAWGVAEIASEAPLSDLDCLCATRLVQVFCNMQSMLNYSECDALTGLWNRKSFEDVFFKALPTSDLQLLPSPCVENRTLLVEPEFWLAMLDIDHFKQVNDVYGHLIGDEVLILMARLMRSSFRSYDRIFRFGGEEFVLVLRCAGHDTAMAVLERFRARMEAFEFPQVGRKTASVGFTKIVTKDSPTAACERADQAVYHAKRNGRNQVCSESDLVQRGLLHSDVKVGDVELF
jgi:diguanylate cyclase (GGDEF)-like protein